MAQSLLHSRSSRFKGSIFSFHFYSFHGFNNKKNFLEQHFSNKFGCLEKKKESESVLFNFLTKKPFHLLFDSSDFMQKCHRNRSINHTLISMKNIENARRLVQTYKISLLFYRKNCFTSF